MFRAKKKSRHQNFLALHFFSGMCCRVPICTAVVYFLLLCLGWEKEEGRLIGICCGFARDNGHPATSGACGVGRLVCLERAGIYIYVYILLGPLGTYPGMTILNRVPGTDFVGMISLTRYGTRFLLGYDQPTRWYLGTYVRNSTVVAG